MSSPSYINLINAFWQRYAEHPLGACTATTYLYILNLINRNRWKPVTISDRELSEILDLSRRLVGGYKKSLIDADLLTIEVKGCGRGAKTWYSLPKINGSLNGSHMVQLKEDNGSYMSHSKPINGSLNGSHMVQLTENTPYISNIIKDIKTSSTRAREEKLSPAQAMQKIISNFFQNCQRSIEAICMKTGASVADLKNAADIIAEEWLNEGKHILPDGSFDYEDAAKHFRVYLRQKYEIISKDPQTAANAREANRRAIAQGAVNALNSSLRQPQQPDKFSKPF